MKNCVSLVDISNLFSNIDINLYWLISCLFYINLLLVSWCASNSVASPRKSNETNAHEDPDKKHSICAPLIFVNALKAAQRIRMKKNNSSSQIGTFTACIRSLWKGNVLSSVCLSICPSVRLSRGAPMWALRMKPLDSWRSHNYAPPLPDLFKCVHYVALTSIDMRSVSLLLKGLLVILNVHVVVLKKHLDTILSANLQVLVMSGAMFPSEYDHLWFAMDFLGALITVLFATWYYLRWHKRKRFV